MNILFTFLIAVALGVSLIVAVMLWVTNKAGHSAITQYFKAAEYIVEHHQPPPEWLKDGALNKARLMQRMDDLILFFEHSTFFEDEHARSTLLDKLNKERDAWESDVVL